MGNVDCSKRMSFQYKIVVLIGLLAISINISLVLFKELSENQIVAILFIVTYQILHLLQFFYFYENSQKNLQ